METLFYLNPLSDGGVDGARNWFVFVVVTEMFDQKQLGDSEVGWTYTSVI